MNKKELRQAYKLMNDTSTPIEVDKIIPYGDSLLVIPKSRREQRTKRN
jgi:hypothetical protein